MDLGGTKILAGVVARDGSVVRRHERSTPQDSQEHVLAELEAAVVELLDDSVAAVGFGAPSPIDQVRGVVVRCVNLPLEDAQRHVLEVPDRRRADGERHQAESSASKPTKAAPIRPAAVPSSAFASRTSLRIGSSASCRATSSAGPRR